MDYFDYESGIYHKNIFAERNPTVIKELGYVAKIDTAWLEVVDECIVGYQPEEMVPKDNKLYVANSGGYRVPKYDSNYFSVLIRKAA